MRRHIPCITALLLVGCPPVATLDDSGPDTTPDDTGPSDGEHRRAVVATVASDYSTGSFASVSLDDWSVADELFVTSGDPAVSASQGSVFQLNRFGYDTVRRYQAGSWGAPLWEQALEDHSNPYVARICDGAVFVTQYDTAGVAVLDLDTGERLGTVDLGAWADADSVGPEPSTLVEHEGMLYAGLNRLDRDQGWIDAGGAVVEIDCAARAATRSWAAGGNTTVHPWPDSGKLLVLARAFGDDPGGVYALDPAADSLEHLLSVEGEELTHIGAVGDQALATSLATDWSHNAHHCIDLAEAALRSSETTDSYITAMASNDRGEAWVALGVSWMDPHAPTGLMVYDIAGCSALSEQPIGLSLYPVGIDFH